MEVEVAPLGVVKRIRVEWVGEAEQRLLHPGQVPPHDVGITRPADGVVAHVKRQWPRLDDREAEEEEEHQKPVERPGRRRFQPLRRARHTRRARGRDAHRGRFRQISLLSDSQFQANVATSPIGRARK